MVMTSVELARREAAGWWIVGWSSGTTTTAVVGVGLVQLVLQCLGWPGG